MIYNSKIKKDPKGFIVESPYTHIFGFGLNFKLACRIIKYKEFIGKNGPYFLIFYKHRGKIYQKRVYKSSNYIGTPRYICNVIKDKHDMLVYTKYKNLALRYLKRYFPEDIL